MVAALSQQTAEQLPQPTTGVPTPANSSNPPSTSKGFTQPLRRQKQKQVLMWSSTTWLKMGGSNHDKSQSGAGANPVTADRCSHFRVWLLAERAPALPPARSAHHLSGECSRSGVHWCFQRVHVHPRAPPMGRHWQSQGQQASCIRAIPADKSSWVPLPDISKGSSSPSKGCKTLVSQPCYGSWQTLVETSLQPAKLRVAEDFILHWIPKATRTSPSKEAA